ncbi:hypothetical protein OK411_12990 [Pseudomonas sp. RG1]|uniref:hypothetical protein n=1 Tax=Pseudomonas sp. RG1 TaxID=2981602 RepID=UPI00221F7C2C|nr:hypothetical protein [Pseudomonas sp. RG1]MCW0921299.1 hypothetical protein [Pseudomonas sp. RG1]
MSGNDDVECAAAFASKLAPTGILVAMKMVDLPRISVGASLLAKADCQAMTMLTVPPPSRAGSLPQGFLVAMKMVDLPRISVEASSLAKAQCQAMTMLNVPPPSRAGSLPQVLAVYSKSR